MKTTIKELLKELDVAVNQNYDSDYLKDVIGALDYKIALISYLIGQSYNLRHLLHPLSNHCHNSD